jgi:hypothetical protein
MRWRLPILSINEKFSFDLKPPPLVEDPDRFYRSGEKKRYKENIEI